MTLQQLNAIPGWVYQLAWSLVTVLVVSLMGRFLARVVCQRLSRWASQTTWKWDDPVVEALKRGIPIWSVFFGLYIATGFWPLPERTLDTLMRSLFVLTWLSVTAISARLVAKLLVVYSREFAQTLPATSLTQNIAKILVVILGALTILHGLGISIAPLLTALGIGGLAVALALQDTLSNLFSGFYLSVERQIHVGDYIKLESGAEGYVEDIGWRATKIRMLPNNMVLVPNNKLSQAIIVNYNLPSRDLAVLVELGVDYDSDLDRVEQVTTEVGQEIMQAVPGGVPAWKPVIRYHTFGDFSINFTVVLRAREFVDQYLIKHEFIKRLHERYKQAGISIPDSRTRIPH